MSNITRKEFKDLRASSKHEFLLKMYEDVFESEQSDLLNIKNLKLKMKKGGQAQIKSNVKTINDQIALLNDIVKMYPSHTEIVALISKLKQVQLEMVKLYKQEYGNIRNRNSML